MDDNLIQTLQPLFCSRAALVAAQQKLNDNPELDCQLRLLFADGTVHPLPIKREDIESLIQTAKSDVEAAINEAS